MPYDSFGEIAEDKLRVALMSYPRSGNTFVRQILKEAYGLSTFTAYPSEGLTEHLGGFIGSANVDNLPVVIMKTHSDTFIDPGVKIWHVVRDGRDAWVSHRCFHGDSVKVDGWGKAVRRMNALADVTTRYEDVIADPVNEVGKALSKLGCPLPVQSYRLTPFRELHERDGHFWRHGTVGDWRSRDVTEFVAANQDVLTEMGYG